jgi:hypothetical protein
MTDTTTQALKTAGDATVDALNADASVIKTDAAAGVDAAEQKATAEIDTAKTDVAGDAAKIEGTVETDVEAIKTDITGEAEKALETGPLVKTVVEAKIAPAIAEAGTIETDVEDKVDAAKLWFDKSQATAGTEATTLQADTLTDIQKAKMAAMDTFTHISNANNGGIISDELTKAKRLLTVIVGYIEAHL